jgi:hypothetical protein
MRPGDILEPEDQEAWERGGYSGLGEGDERQEKILYRLPQLIAAVADRGPKGTSIPRIEICEGEPDADIGAELGFNTTSAPFGALTWDTKWSPYFLNCDVALPIDSDENGRKRAWKLSKELKGIAKSLKVVEFAPHKDMKAWVESERVAGKTDEAITAAYLAKRNAAPSISKWKEAERRAGRPDGSHRGSERPIDEGSGSRAHGDNRFRRDNNNRIVANQENILVALDLLQIKLSFDSFANRGLIEGELFEKQCTIDDASIVRLWMEIESRYEFRAGKDYFWCFIIDQARQNSFHPVRDYLAGLTWDGTPRLDEWLIKYAGAEDTPYTRAVSAKPLIAAVRRAQRPGTKFDEMLVLEAPQGYNRSSALRILAVNDEWFTDDIPLNADSKVVIERLSGKWIAEASELKGMRKGDVEHLKAMLSRQVDRARLAYDRTPTEYPRQSVFIGTTNSASYLRDMTGDRRYWPVAVERFDLEALKANRDQLWAEAAHREVHGESVHLPEALWEAATGEQELRRVDDPFAGVLDRKFTDAELPDHIKIRCEDVWRLLGIPEGHRSQEHNNRVGSAMQALGFKRTKLKWIKKTEWCYFRGASAGCKKVIAYQPYDEKQPWEAKLFSTENADARKVATDEAMRAAREAARDGSPEAALRAAMGILAAWDMPIDDEEF